MCAISVHSDARWLWNMGRKKYPFRLCTAGIERGTQWRTSESTNIKYAYFITPTMPMRAFAHWCLAQLSCLMRVMRKLGSNNNWKRLQCLSTFVNVGWICTSTCLLSIAYAERTFSSGSEISVKSKWTRSGATNAPFILQFCSHIYESWHLMFGRMITYPLVTAIFDGMFANADTAAIYPCYSYRHIKYARVAH